MGKKSAARVRIKQIGGSGNNAATPPTMDDLFSNPMDIVKDLPPPKQDSNTSIIWPLSYVQTPCSFGFLILKYPSFSDEKSVYTFLNAGQTFTLKYKHFSAIYPSYIDHSKSTTKGGRRISKSRSVHDPTIHEMSLILQSMNIRHVIQPYKCYPRDVGHVPSPCTQNQNCIMNELAVRQEKNTEEEDEDDSSLQDFDHYAPLARGRILVDLNQAEERWKLQQQWIKSNTINNMPILQVDEEDEEEALDREKSRTVFTKKVLLEEIAKQMDSLPARIVRLQELKKKERKKLLSLQDVGSNKKKQQQPPSQGKKKK